MAAPTAAAVFRVEVVTTLRQAGAHPGSHRYRLTCMRLAASEVGTDVPILPMPKASRAPRQTAPQAAPVPWVQPLVPRPAQRSSGRVQTHSEGGDFGPSLRRKVVRDRYGRLLREADVEVDEQSAGDPRYPNRRVRRARRVDPLDDLSRVGTIGRREVEAAEDLRAALEGIASIATGAIDVRVDTSPHHNFPMTPLHVISAAKIRGAAVALGERLWHPVLWVVLGGTVRGYCAQWHVSTHRASRLVGDGLARLGDHFYGRAV